MTVTARKKDGIRIAARSRASGPVRRQDRPLRGREITISVDREDLEIEMLSERIRNALQASGITPEQAVRNLSEVRARRFRDIHGACR